MHGTPIVMNSEPVQLESPLSSFSKKARLTCDERVQLNRERNRMHARKTRERKKQQTVALQMRINELRHEARHLRQVVDERYTASALLGLSNDQSEESEETMQLISSASLCCTSFAAAFEKCNSLGEQSFASSELISISGKRVRRRGKYTPQERECIRRERNRMHAKKTRDRKKIFLEASEKIILEMERETCKLRQYLVSLNLMTHEEESKATERDLQSRRALAILKASQNEYFNDDEYEDELTSTSVNGFLQNAVGADVSEDDEEGYDDDEEYDDNIEEGGYERDNDNDGSGGSLSGSESSDQNKRKAAWNYSDALSSSSSSSSVLGRSSGGGNTTEDSAGNSCSGSNNSNSGINCGSSGSGSGSDDGNDGSEPVNNERGGGKSKGDADSSATASSISNKSSTYREGATSRSRPREVLASALSSEKVDVAEEEELTNSDGSSSHGNSSGNCVGGGSGGTSPLPIEEEEKACQTLTVAEHDAAVALNILTQRIAPTTAHSNSTRLTAPINCPTASGRHSSSKPPTSTLLNEEHLYLQGISDALYRYQNEKDSNPRDDRI